MTKRAAVITQADVARVLRAVKAAGYDGTVKIRPDGTIEVVKSGDTGDASPAWAGQNGVRLTRSKEIVL